MTTSKGCWNMPKEKLTVDDPDANVLLYAYDMDAPQHAAAAKWLAALAAGNEVIGIPWLTIWAFLRISTSSRIYARPKPVKEAFSIIHDWLAQPGVVTPEPGPRHVRILEDLMNSYAVSGGLVTDAVLAAIAMEKLRSHPLTRTSAVFPTCAGWIL
jgi:toxin-antitoxin system PIN domain toxin